MYYKVLAELPYGGGQDETTDDLLKIRMKVDRPKPGKAKQSSLLYEASYYDTLLRKYFQLDVNLEDECAKWAKAHTHFQKVAKDQATAIRQLAQDPVENLFSFICSQNNHINRISSLVEKLAEKYGEEIGKVDGVSYYSFPAVDKFTAKGVEEDLRQASFGYRAKFINKSAQEIMEKGGLKWFQELQDMAYEEAHKELMSLTGIGPKVSDCICLMSLGHLSAIPVDTHIFKIAQEHYIKDLKSGKTVTPTVYARIADTFREVYGPMAGWAQTVLFCADLKQFQGSSEEKKVAKKRKGD